MKENSGIAEIRHEYNEKKKQLKKYDTFVDRHQGLVVFLPLLFVLLGVLVLVGITSGSTGDNLTAKVIGILSLVLLVVAIVMAFITGSRKSAKGKIDRQLEALKQEATIFQTHAKDHNNITRDELGLWRDIAQDTDKAHSNKGGWVMLIIVIVVVAAVGSVTQANKRNQEAAERARQTQIMQQQQAKQQQDALEQRKLDQQDEANRLQQQKNAIDLYNSTKPDSSDYRSSTSCSTSYYGGYTAYTTCN